MKTVLRIIAALLFIALMTALAIYGQKHGAFGYTDRPPSVIEGQPWVPHK